MKEQIHDIEIKEKGEREEKVRHRQWKKRKNIGKSKA
jgi:hypothetical protein